MIRKLKIKFILTNMLLISIVLCFSFSLMYFNTAREIESKSIEAMRDIARSKPNNLDGLFGNNDKKSKYPNYSAYILDIDSRNNSCYIDGFGDTDNLTEENVNYINELIRAVRSMDEQEGVLKKYNMRYYYEENPFGVRIVLLDKQYEDENLRQFLLSLIIGGGIAILAIFLISLIIANIVVKPVEKSIKQQKQLISDVSHELKTPLTVISTNTDLVLSHNDSTVEQESKWLGYIKDESTRMTDLINTMLYLAKSDESKIKPKLSTVNISNLCYEIALPFETICFEKGKSFEIHIENELFAKCDEVSIKQLLAILLDNAVKYSDENGRIELNLSSKGDKTHLSVFNTGVPIPKESIPLLFERFYRVDEARSRECGGSGLGLSIARTIIENNDASISISSNEQHGTVFTCILKSDKKKIQED